MSRTRVRMILLSRGEVETGVSDQTLPTSVSPAYLQMSEGERERGSRGHRRGDAKVSCQARNKRMNEFASRLLSA